jgi:hypothetical protein
METSLLRPGTLACITSSTPAASCSPVTWREPTGCVARFTLRASQPCGCASVRERRLRTSNLQAGREHALFFSRRLLRCAEYDSIAGVYTMLYRYSQFSPWVIQGQVVEQSIYNSWGKIISPRVGLMLKNWVTNQPTLADFTQFTCGSLGLWARAATSYFPPANVLTLPLPRRVLYDVSVYAVSAAGVWSPAAVAQVTPLAPIVVGPQPASALPGVNALAAGAVCYLDPSGSNQQVPSLLCMLHTFVLALDALCDPLFNCCRLI